MALLVEAQTFWRELVQMTCRHEWNGILVRCEECGIVYGVNPPDSHRSNHTEKLLGAFCVRCGATADEVPYVSASNETAPIQQGK